MKKSLVAVAVIAALAIAGQAYAAGITGTAHDFRGTSWYTGNQICVVCHTPHKANLTVQPLWNHTMGTNNYTNNLTTVFGTSWGAVNGASLLCLSCHDGTVALDSYGGNVGSNFIGTGGRVGNGTTLNGNHPISINYTPTLITSGELRTETDAKSAGVFLYGAAGSGKIECGSCHDVHNGADIKDGLLRVTNTGSTLCLACHIK